MTIGRPHGGLPNYKGNNYCYRVTTGKDRMKTSDTSNRINFRFRTKPELNPVSRNLPKLERPVQKIPCQLCTWNW